jgi:hypothetical protein
VNGLSEKGRRGAGDSAALIEELKGVYKIPGHAGRRTMGLPPRPETPGKQI